MTLDEFAEKEKARMLEQERMQEEAKKNQPNDDSDDEEAADRKTYEARAWDDWKDLNEKGSGNKMGKQ
jgi:immunoglobulin-binding protein 1